MNTEAGTPEQSRALVKTLACVLQKLVDVNRKLDSQSTQVVTKFHASRAPNITILDYLERINKYASCSTECLVLALIYIDRLIQHGNFALTALNIHRVIITSIMLAAKFFDDQYFNNLYYAKVGGVPCKEINTLEVDFLFYINFSLHVSQDVFRRYSTELCNHANSGCPTCSPSLESCSPGLAVQRGTPHRHQPQPQQQPVSAIPHSQRLQAQHQLTPPPVTPQYAHVHHSQILSHVPSPVYARYSPRSVSSASPIMQPPTSSPDQQLANVMQLAQAAHVQQPQPQQLCNGLHLTNTGSRNTSSTCCGLEPFTSYFSYEPHTACIPIENPQSAHGQHLLYQQQQQQQEQQQQQAAAAQLQHLLQQQQQQLQLQQEQQQQQQQQRQLEQQQHQRSEQCHHQDKLSAEALQQYYGIVFDNNIATPALTKPSRFPSSSRLMANPAANNAAAYYARYPFLYA